MGRRGLLPRQIGGDGAGGGDIGILFDRRIEIGVEVNVVVRGLVVVEAVFVVERRSDGLGLGLFHRREMSGSRALVVGGGAAAAAGIGMRHTESDQQLITGGRETRNMSK